jgi:DNA-binding HxlR family transcriptional regulator
MQEEIKMSSAILFDSARAKALVETCEALPPGVDQAVLALLRKLFDKWPLPVLGALTKQPWTRYSALSRALPAVTPRVLARTLRDLENEGLVERAVRSTVPVHVEYALTDRGLSLLEAAIPLLRWFYKKTNADTFLD